MAKVAKGVDRAAAVSKEVAAKAGAKVVERAGAAVKVVAAAKAAVRAAEAVRADASRESLFVGQWVAPFLLLGVCNKIVKVAGSDRATA